jgi:hypothetical protein
MSGENIPTRQLPCNSSYEKTGVCIYVLENVSEEEMSKALWMFDEVVD